MSARELLDKTRSKFIDADTAPTRAIIYIKADGTNISLNSFVGAGQFNKEERDKLGDMQVFSGLKLSFRPNTDINGDSILHDGVTYKVRRYTKLGELYNVVAEISRHRGRPKR